MLIIVDFFLPNLLYFLRHFGHWDHQFISH